MGPVNAKGLRVLIRSKQIEHPSVWGCHAKDRFPINDGKLKIKRSIYIYIYIYFKHAHVQGIEKGALTFSLNALAIPFPQDPWQLHASVACR